MVICADETILGMETTSTWQIQTDSMFTNMLILDEG